MADPIEFDKRTPGDTPGESVAAKRDGHAPDGSGREVIYPLIFSTQRRSSAAGVFFRDPSLQKLVEFFENKGLAALKDEDQRQQWHEDWIAFQQDHRLYASLLSPGKYSTSGNHFDVRRLTRFLEVFAYFSPAHGYSLQVTFLGLFAILMGSNDALKREAAAALEAGALFALGVSEKDHGSDLLANEFSVADAGNGSWVANGTKYYIGNANCAAFISILARKSDERRGALSRRATPILFALRPGKSSGFGSVRKIPTLGIRSAFVGEFQVKDQEVRESDWIGEGRTAWDAVIGTVTLGKFFLGFGSVGICERAMEEALAHLTRRVLYGKPVIDMPHIGAAVSHAYARLTGMKCFAYRAVDYVQSASAEDRRYLLFCAVQKARVSTEGVKVISLLSECIGARGFESETYVEMALRDVQLIPSLEGSIHINLAATAEFIPRYFDDPDENLGIPESSAARDSTGENRYLMEARSGRINAVGFRRFLEAYEPLKAVANVRIFCRQAGAFGRFARTCLKRTSDADSHVLLQLGQCMAAIAYGQLVAETASRIEMPRGMISAIFHLLVGDLSNLAIALASSPRVGKIERVLIRRMIAVPRTSDAEWDFVLQKARLLGQEARAVAGPMS